MRSRSPLFAALALCLALPVRAEQGTPTVLYPLRSLGLAPESGQALEASLRNELASMPEVKLVERAAVEASLQAERDPDCLARLSCAASAAARAGAQQLVSGTVSGLGDAVLVDLKLVDARSGQELRRVTHPINGKQDQLIELLHAAAVELLAPARYTGRLRVSLVRPSGDGAAPAPVPSEEARGATLFIDGREVAKLPLDKAIEGLAPGQRALRVSKEGFRDATMFVEIRFERTTEALIDLPRGALTVVAFLRADQPSPATAPAASVAAPPLAVGSAPLEPRGVWMKIAGWSGLGLGVVSAGVGLALHLKAYQTSSTLNARYAADTLDGPDDQSLYTDVNTEVDAARVLYSIGAVLAAGGGGLLLYDHHLDQQRFSAAPIVTPSGGGVGVTGAF